jgi:hypothetical protein
LLVISPESNVLKFVHQATKKKVSRGTARRKTKQNVSETNEIRNYVCDFLLQSLCVDPVNDFRHRVAKLQLCKPQKELKKLMFA